MGACAIRHSTITWLLQLYLQVGYWPRGRATIDIANANMIKVRMSISVPIETRTS